MDTAFEPSIFFISEADWQDEAKKDNFLQHLLDNLNIIDDFKITKIYWTDELEEFLWNSPQLPPWRLDRDWKLKIVPIIYNKLKSYLKLVNYPENLTICSVQPEITYNYDRIEIFESFLKLLHHILEKREEIFLCVGLENRLRGNHKYCFFCGCHKDKLKPELINSSNDWLHHIDLVNNYWPDNCDEIDNFRTALDIERKRSFSGKKFLYAYEFDRNFIRDIISTNKHRDKILKSLVTRMTSTRQEASLNPQLQDEYIESRKEYRLRVTASTRIHYTIEKKILRFKRYYDESEHDNGL
jgi:hypothetical protein